MECGRRLAANVRRLREELGLKQGELAERSGLNRATINRVENGHTIPEWDFICAIADGLGCSLEELRREI